MPLKDRVPRKQSLRWCQSRLRRLRSIKKDELSVRQFVRIRQLERAIADCRK